MTYGGEGAWRALEEVIKGCRSCDRLVSWRERVATEKRRAYRDEVYWGLPVPGFGDPDGRVLAVGLAPAAHGANRTGRVFTGDSSADFLFASLHRAGFANQPISRRREDGLALHGLFISLACRCAPPDNRPAPDELRACLPFLARELALLPNLRVVVALGSIAFEAILRLYGPSGRERPRFAHNARHSLGAGAPALVSSYHPSRQNTQTGRLTTAMLDEVWLQARVLAFAPDEPAWGQNVQNPGRTA